VEQLLRIPAFVVPFRYAFDRLSAGVCNRGAAMNWLRTMLAKLRAWWAGWNREMDNHDDGPPI
jgi:hypothetical protein